MYSEHLVKYIQSRNTTAKAYEVFSNAADTCGELAKNKNPDKATLIRIETAENIYVVAKNKTLRSAFQTIDAAEKTINALAIELAELQKACGQWPAASREH